MFSAQVLNQIVEVEASLMADLTLESTVRPTPSVTVSGRKVSLPFSSVTLSLLTSLEPNLAGATLQQTLQYFLLFFRIENFSFSRVEVLRSKTF